MKYNLENLHVPEPCSMNWDEMKGGSEIRQCEKCQHPIYNLSEMTKSRALKVLNQKEDRVCVSYLKDEKNQVLIQNYFGIFQRKFIKVLSVILAIVFSFSSIQAMQIKNSKPKKKKVVKHRKHKNKKLPQKPIVGKRVIRTVGMPQLDQ